MPSPNVVAIAPLSVLPSDGMALNCRAGSYTRSQHRAGARALSPLPSDLRNSEPRWTPAIIILEGAPGRPGVFP